MSFSDVPEDQKPKIEFPCQYPIKVMGDAADDFQDYVIKVMQAHAEVDLHSIKMKQSGKGTFQSVTVIITATGVPQLEAIFAELKLSGRVKMVL
ncbi:MAG: putative lipoic acid-binding regulatory protein [Pseudohongiellaceae bacterium]|jgi:putative lipoic acid-binding regulatory protein